MMPLIKKLQEKTVLSLTDAVTVTQSFDGSAQSDVHASRSSLDDNAIDPSFHQADKSERMPRSSARKDYSMCWEDQAVKFFVSFAVVRASCQVTKNFSRIIEPTQ
jgi:hypothetical protein